jgi:hypothetical protein
VLPLSVVRAPPALPPATLPAVALPIDPIIALPPIVASDSTASDGLDEITLPDYTSRSTLPADFDVEEIVAFVPPRGLSPEDVVVLALAMVLGIGLVVWEVEEEREWTN